MVADGIVLGRQALAQIREVVLRVLKSPITQPRSQKRRHVSVTGAPIVFYNQSGGTCPTGALMRIVSTALEEERLVYRIEKPNDTFERQYLINIGEDIADVDYGPASWLEDSGFFLAEGSPVLNDEYGAKAGQWAAVKNRQGFTVTGGKTGTGSEQRVCGRQSIIRETQGKVNGSTTIAKGSTGTLSVWLRNSSTGAWEDTPYDIPVRALGTAVKNGKWADVAYRCGEWLVGPWECA